jgi:hypothetical protein
MSAAGRMTVRFTGVLAGRPLAIGRWRLTLTARDSVGNVGTPRHAPFVVLG